MFSGCRSLESLNLSNFNTSLVTNMNQMFYQCYSLKSLNLSNFNTSLVTNMVQMFMDCNSLELLVLSNFSTSLVTTLWGLFYGCSSLKSLNLINFNTSLVEDMDEMFYGCSSLEFLNLTNFNTSSVLQMQSMFFGCSSLKSLDLSSFNTSLVYYFMFDMFNGCSSLKSLNLSNFNTSSVHSMSRMFYGCSSLEFLDISNFNTENALDEPYFFVNLSSIKYLNIHSYIGKDIFQPITNENPHLIYCYDSKLNNNSILSLLLTNSINNCSFFYNSNNINKDVLNFLIIGIDNYKELPNQISFFLYLINFSKNNLIILDINLTLYFSNNITKTKITKCNLIENTNSFSQYNCNINLEFNETTINKVLINDNYGTESKTVIDFCPLSLGMTNNISYQKNDRFSSKKLSILYNSSLIIDQEKILIQGVLNNSDFDSNVINISVFNEISDEEKEIICCSKNISNYFYELECYSKSNGIIIAHLNKTLGETNNKILLILFDKEENDLLYINQVSNIQNSENLITENVEPKSIEFTENIENTGISNITKNDTSTPTIIKSSGLSKGNIILIIISCVGALIIALAIFIIIKIKKYSNIQKLHKINCQSTESINK